MKLAFLIGPSAIGGGSYVIFQHALYAQRTGHEVTLIHIMPKTTTLWHEALKELHFISIEEYDNEAFDLVLATWWQTVYYLKFINAVKYGYIVQSIESFFCKNDDIKMRCMIDATYTLPLSVITEATWIKEYLEHKYGRDCFLAHNGIRKDYLNVTGGALAARMPGRLRVLVEGPLGVDFKNVARTIRLARHGGADEVWWLTADDMTWYPGVDRVFSRVSASNVGAVYRSCDVLLKLSYVEGMFGPPLEIFHCGGTAIVYDVTGYEEYITDGVNALVVPMDDEECAIKSLQKLKKSPELLKRLQLGALQSAQEWPCWDTASARFMECVEMLCAGDSCSSQEIELALEPFRSIFAERSVPSFAARLKKGIVDAVRTFPACKRLVAPMAYWAADRLRRHSPRRDQSRCF